MTSDSFKQVLEVISSLPVIEGKWSDLMSWSDFWLQSLSLFLSGLTFKVPPETGLFLCLWKGLWKCVLRVQKTDKSLSLEFRVNLNDSGQEFFSPIIYRGEERSFLILVLISYFFFIFSLRSFIISFIKLIKIHNSMGKVFSPESLRRSMKIRFFMIWTL